MAVRMVLEEGKLNMCLRVLQEYKTLVRPDGAFISAARSACSSLGLTETELSASLCVALRFYLLLTVILLWSPGSSENEPV